MYLSYGLLNSQISSIKLVIQLNILRELSIRIHLLTLSSISIFSPPVKPIISRFQKCQALLVYVFYFPLLYFFMFKSYSAKTSYNASSFVKSSFMVQVETTTFISESWWHLFYYLSFTLTVLCSGWINWCPYFSLSYYYLTGNGQLFIVTFGTTGEMSLDAWNLVRGFSVLI